MFSTLPDEISPDQIIACLGLISDTHMPQRWAQLPPSLFSVLRGADLILHAGDIGELWVLDQLSAIAPVVAVHGNDETIDAQTHLPFQQVLTVAGRRLLLWHSHYPDRETELSMRRFDVWARILHRSAKQAQAAGAQIVIMGHLHVPFCTQYEGIWIINPGALASGNYQSRQAVQTVALLFLLSDGDLRVSHIDLAPPNAVHRPEIDWSAPFSTALKQYSANILAPGLDDTFSEIGRRLFAQWPDEYHTLVGRPAHKVWSGKQAQVTAADLLGSLANVPGLPAGERAHIQQLLSGLGSRR